MNRSRRWWLIMCCWLPSAWFVGTAAAAPEPLLAAQTNKHFILLRHAKAPGTGDPPGYDLNNCGSQRNLSNAGREQALALGRWLKQHGITEADVLSSEWCRCKDTAALLDLGPLKTLPALNSFFDSPGQAQQQLQQLTKILLNYDWQRPVILVTHQVVISGLTGQYPGSGEMVVVKVTDEGELQTFAKVQTF